MQQPRNELLALRLRTERMLEEVECAKGRIGEAIDMDERIADAELQRRVRHLHEVGDRLREAEVAVDSLLVHLGPQRTNEVHCILRGLRERSESFSLSASSPKNALDAHNAVIASQARLIAFLKERSEAMEAELRSYVLSTRHLSNVLYSVRAYVYTVMNERSEWQRIVGTNPLNQRTSAGEDDVFVKRCRMLVDALDKSEPPASQWEPPPADDPGNSVEGASRTSSCVCPSLSRASSPECGLRVAEGSANELQRAEQTMSPVMRSLSATAHSIAAFAATTDRLKKEMRLVSQRNLRAQRGVQSGDVSGAWRGEELDAAPAVQPSYGDVSAAVDDERDVAGRFSQRVEHRRVRDRDVAADILHGPAMRGKKWLGGGEPLRWVQPAEELSLLKVMLASTGVSNAASLVDSLEVAHRSAESFKKTTATTVRGACVEMRHELSGLRRQLNAFTSDELPRMINAAEFELLRIGIAHGAFLPPSTDADTIQKSENQSIASPSKNPRGSFGASLTASRPSSRKASMVQITSEGDSRTIKTPVPPRRPVLSRGYVSADARGDAKKKGSLVEHDAKKPVHEALVDPQPSGAHTATHTGGIERGALGASDAASASRNGGAPLSESTVPDAAVPSPTTTVGVQEAERQAISKRQDGQHEITLEPDAAGHQAGGPERRIVDAAAVPTTTSDSCCQTDAFAAHQPEGGLCVAVQTNEETDATSEGALERLFSAHAGGRSSEDNYIEVKGPAEVYRVYRYRRVNVEALLAQASPSDIYDAASARSNTPRRADSSLPHQSHRPWKAPFYSTTLLGSPVVSHASAIPDMRVIPNSPPPTAHSSQPDSLNTTSRAVVNAAHDRPWSRQAAIDRRLEEAVRIAERIEQRQNSRPPSQASHPRIRSAPAHYRDDIDLTIRPN